MASLDDCAILGLRGDLCNCNCDDSEVVGVFGNRKFFLSGLAGVRIDLLLLDLLAFANTFSGNKELRSSFLSSKCSFKFTICCVSSLLNFVIWNSRFYDYFLISMLFLETALFPLLLDPLVPVLLFLRFAEVFGEGLQKSFLF